MGRFINSQKKSAVALISRFWLCLLVTTVIASIFPVFGVCAQGVPTTTSVIPNSGPASGGTTVRITGTNFSGATAVLFGNTNASSFTVNSDTAITATTPSSSAAIVNVTVVVPGGTGTLTSAFTFTSGAAPQTGPVSSTVSYNSSVNPITLDLSGGAATSVSVATAASHGTATANETSITYTPAIGYSGPDSFTYTATNAFGTSSASTVTVTVMAPTLFVSPASLPNASVTTSYSVTFSASGGMAPYSASLTGVLPAGLTFDAATSTLSGTPTAIGSSNFRIAITDSSSGNGPFTVYRDYTLIVSAPTITLPPTIPSARAGQDYSQQITASGGTPSYTYSHASGTIPPGLSLNSDGLLSGKPTAVGTFLIVVQAKDANGFLGTQPYTISVLPPNFGLLTSSSGPAFKGRPYSQTFTVTGGNGPFTYTSTGTLPPGLSFSSDGVLSGEPTAIGSYTFVVIGRDSTQGSGAPYAVGSSFSITVSASPLLVTSISPIQGSTTGGTEVTFLGTGFRDVTTVTFGGAPASGFVIHDDSTITAMSPPHAAGAVDVAVGYSSGTGAGRNGAFTYVAPGRR
ncbi:putative Ig domain-containing protein [Ochrobactrum sp. GPK 3]